MQKLFLYSLIVAAIWHQGLALICYDCLICNSVSSSDVSEVCPDISGLKTMCISVEGTVLGIGTTARGCGYGTSETCSTSSIFGVTGTVCYCATDLCNGDGVNGAGVTEAAVNGDGVNGAEALKISVMMGTLIAGILAKILM
ncbi:uncharacterized protein LOC120348371 [Styela clava]|uniref:uncharacterized protein LOC120348371 n=1 Tax=Styela clava TaxID=7725 RepID=UPI00193A5044|nr:uncharacterized protein LOC120348371 [Styela clava]